MRERWLTPAAALTFLLGVSSVPSARAASITFIGADGAAGEPSGGIMPGGDGAPGQNALADALSPDTSNTAHATGGAGGAGGASDVSDPQSTPLFPAGAGGYGGVGVANASASSAVDPVTANSGARGGNGGAGGLDSYEPAPSPIDFAPIYGPGGNGGRAVSHADAHSDAADATALSSATGGLGGAGGRTLATAIPTPGARGDAYATATASSDLGSADGEAGANGSHALAVADSLSGTKDSNASAIATGVSGNAGGLQAADDVPTAAATARSLGNGGGAATAYAQAVGNSAHEVSPGAGIFTGGDAHATAQADAQSGDASALVQLFAGGAGGGPGRSLDAENLVHGSSPTKLTLQQETYATNASNAFDGGSARSRIDDAINTAGGDLFVTSIAVGGNAGEVCSSPGTCTFGSAGGDANVEVRATGSRYVEAVGSAQGGQPAQSSTIGFATPPASNWGHAASSVTAIGPNSLRSHAIAKSETGGAAHADAAALGMGSIAHVSGSLDVSSSPSFVRDGLRVPWGAVADAGIATSSHALATLPTPQEGGFQGIFARPLEAEASALLAGNPNAQLAAQQRGGVLAMGSLGGTVQGAGSNASAEDLSFGGSLNLDLTAASFPQSESLALAFLNPLGEHFDFFSLTVTKAGAVVYQQNFQTTSGLADLVVELGPAANPGGDELTRYSIAWALGMREDSSIPPSSFNTFSLDFAFLGATPAPEPHLLPLLSVLSAALWAARCRKVSP